MKIYRVNQIRYQRAVEKEKLQHPALEKFIGDFDTFEEAKEIYNSTATGTEVDKELINIETGNIILTTY